MNETHDTSRRFQDAGEAAVFQLWHCSGRAAYTFLPTWQALTIEHAQRVFYDVIRPKCTIWVGLRDTQMIISFFQWFILNSCNRRV